MNLLMLILLVRCSVLLWLGCRLFDCDRLHIWLPLNSDIISICLFESDTHIERVPSEVFGRIRYREKSYQGSTKNGHHPATCLIELRSMFAAAASSGYAYINDMRSNKKPIPKPTTADVTIINWNYIRIEKERRKQADLHHILGFFLSGIVHVCAKFT